MWNRRTKRDIPEINATSTADMAFMLLVFFLLTTSMEKEKVIPRILSPANDSVMVSKPVQVKKRNLLEIKINASGEILCNDRTVAINDLEETVRLFIENPENDSSLPEKHVRNIPLLGDVAVTDGHVIAIRYDEDTDYHSYFEVQNKVINVYRKLREELCHKAFHCEYKDADTDEKEALRAYYPQRISESMVIRKGDR